MLMLFQARLKGPILLILRESYVIFNHVSYQRGFFFFFFGYKILHANGFPDILFLWSTNFLYMVPNPTLIKPLTGT